MVIVDRGRTRAEDERMKRRASAAGGLHLSSSVGLCGWVGACGLVVSALVHAGCGDDAAATTSTGEVSSTAASTAPTTGGSGETEEGSTGTSDSGSGSSGNGSTTGEPDPLWDEFVAMREDYLHALAVPIGDCIVLGDTEHPAFHGCIDWHSAVHASYSLLAIARITGDSSYRDLADETLDADALTAELTWVEGGLLPQELPYGYAWFLTLAREREAGGDSDLLPLADAIADELRAWLAARSPEQLLEGGLADDYANVSWAALNLYRWAEHSGDDLLRVEIETFVDEVLLDPVFDEMCPLSKEESDADDFFPPCLQRAYALSEILDEPELASWLGDYLPQELTLTPILDPSEAHIAGLNFSRAWGLWALYRATGETQWRTLYVEHVVAHMEQPAYWAEDYYKHSHWVAQFGVYAIALSYD